MNVLFVSKLLPRYNKIAPFTISQAKGIINNGVNISYFPTKGSGIYSYIKSIISLHYYLKKKEFDIIHSHYALQGMISLLAAPHHKHVVSFMGSDINDIFPKRKLNLCLQLKV